MQRVVTGLTWARARALSRWRSPTFWGLAPTSPRSIEMRARCAGSPRRWGGGSPATRVETLVADFRKTLSLAGLDGVVMANSLHFVRDKQPVLAGVMAMLRPGGRLIVVEYGSDRGNPWVPHPFTYARWEHMAAEAGFEQTRQLGAVPSRYLGSMYSAVTFAPQSRKSD